MKKKLLILATFILALNLSFAMSDKKHEAKNNKGVEKERFARENPKYIKKEADRVVYEPTKTEVITAKKALNKKGFKVDASTAQIDNKTREQIKLFQANNTLEMTGELDLATLKELKSKEALSE